LFAAFTDDSNSQWLMYSASWQLAILAFIYSSAVMAIVIVTLMKSARKRRPEAQNKA
jgi:membrane protein implicated in regulation of membrane protease activity